METFLRILGDGLTIAALSILWGASRVLWRKVPADARIPLPWGGRGSRALGLWFMPTLAAVALLGLTVYGLAHRDMSLDTAVILFGVRSLLTALLALAHLTHLRKVLQALTAEGVIEP